MSTIPFQPLRAYRGEVLVLLLLAAFVVLYLPVTGTPRASIIDSMTLSGFTTYTGTVGAGADAGDPGGVSPYDVVLRLLIGAALLGVVVFLYKVGWKTGKN